ncbi:DUF1269 domain-containing protein [Streptosporangium saharense]|uniref:DUF1269 domain-containing protein n=1 Tax=Streptosporangium saharense TaxID=1706840 RepID=UPI003327F137
MSELVAVAYSHLDDALRARQALLASKPHAGLADLELVEHRPDGRVVVHPTHHRASTYAAEGAVAGALIGLVALGPIIGIALAAAGLTAAAAGGTVLGAGTAALAGAGTGAAIKEADDNSLDTGFVKELGEHLPPGGAALFLLLTSGIEEIVDAIAPYGGHVIRTTLRAAEEERVQKAITTARSTRDACPPG